MRVNDKKTQILCIHPSSNDNVTSYIRAGSGEILSKDTLKILGFHFDHTPTATKHVTETINNFYSKLWTLRFLKRSGMGAADLIKIYKTVIRAGAEYCSVVYHSLIPDYMAERLERVQEQAMKIIYGRGLNYRRMVQEGELETLQERRRTAVKKFALKASKSARFGDKWFPKNLSLIHI